MQFRRASRWLEVTLTVVWIPVAIAGFFVGYVSFHPELLVYYYWDAMDQYEEFRNPLILAFSKHYFSVFVTTVVLLGPPWAYWRTVRKTGQNGSSLDTAGIRWSRPTVYLPATVWFLVSGLALFTDSQFHFPDLGFVLDPSRTPDVTPLEFSLYVFKVSISALLFLGPAFLYCLTLRRLSVGATPLPAHQSKR